jgi:hypothetical protein
MTCRIYPYIHKYHAIEIECDSVKEALQLRYDIREHLKNTGADFTASLIPHTRIVKIQPRISIEDAHRFMSEFVRSR